MSRFDNYLDYYLWNMDASKEERLCTRMWVRDDHWIDENDHGMKDTDFLSAARAAECYYREYTDSFYDPGTQEYIRKLKPTRAEMRRLRKHIRDGGRFYDDFFTDCAPVDYITWLRTKDDHMTAEFDSEFGDWITKYGAEYLLKNRQEGKFIEFLETKPDYITDRR